MTEPAAPPLPRIATPLSGDAVLDRLRTASKRGRLPGFHAVSEGRFRIAAHGHPFDGVLRAELQNGHVQFSLRMLRRMPTIFAVVLLLTIWPGVVLMDQLIPGEWGWIPTWWWYIPITAIPIPWMWRALMRKSRTSMDVAARETIQKVAAEVDGKVVGDEPRTQ